MHKHLILLSIIHLYSCTSSYITHEHDKIKISITKPELNKYYALRASIDQKRNLKGESKNNLTSLRLACNLFKKAVRSTKKFTPDKSDTQYQKFGAKELLTKERNQLCRHYSMQQMLITQEMANKSIHKKKVRLKEEARLKELGQPPPKLLQSQILSSNREDIANISTTVLNKNRPRSRKRKYKKTVWYGYQIILTELLDVFYGIPYLFAAPMVHLHHGEKGNALRSFLIRLGLPSIGFAIGKARFGTGGFNMIAVWFSAFIGAVIAVVYDVSVIAYKDIRYRKFGIITPTIGEPTPRASKYEQSTLFNLNFSF